MKLCAVLALTVAAYAAEPLEVFNRKWTVPVASDWQVTQEDGAQVLKMVQSRGPLPGPRRPIQFALADAPYKGGVTVEADVKPLIRSLLIVFAYRDEAHFDYTHLSTDTGRQQPVHNGVFHVYGGERVRISGEDGPPSFASINRWYHVILTHDATAKTVEVTVDGKAVPALKAVDFSLGGGRVGIGSFDETAEFRNVRISTR